MRVAVALRLARVSNLPTVWSNVLVGAILAGGGMADPRVPLVIVAMSLFYSGGMFLNDAFDREFDARMRPDRPIPSGQVGAAQVFGFAFGMFALGTLLLLQVGYGQIAGTQWHPAAVGSALVAAIVCYDRWHKSNPISPLLMGLCRMLVYLIAALAIAPIVPGDVYVAAIVLLCYLIGLTYAAKQEHLARVGSWWPLALLAVPAFYGMWLSGSNAAVWPVLTLFVVWTIYAVGLLARRRKGDGPRAIVSLIAGISLLDATILAGNGAWLAATAGIGAFVLTLILQRWVSGT